MLDLMRDTWRSRAYGDFYGYMLLAEGALDVMVEPELSLWDVAALVPIVTEAGGTVTDLAGRPRPGRRATRHRQQRGGHQRSAARATSSTGSVGQPSADPPAASILARWSPPAGASSRR